MYLSTTILIISALATSSSAKLSNIRCPLLGPQFPAPTNVSSSRDFQNGLAALNANITKFLKDHSSPYGDGDFAREDFSIVLFNAQSNSFLYEYHHTSQTTAKSESGTRKISADSIYRLASISKLLTAYLLLAKDGERHLNIPIAEFVPDFARPTNVTGLGPLLDFSEITLVDLMSQLAGTPYNFGYDGKPPEYITDGAAPPVPLNDTIPCAYLAKNGSYVGCTREQLIQVMKITPALFQPGHTPVYSNPGFDVVALAIEAITGRTIRDVFEEVLIKGLGLSSTSFSVPAITKNSVVYPGEHHSPSEWFQDYGYVSPDGGYFSSSNDMATFGRAILRHEKLSRAITNRWLKPRTFTSSLGSASSVGAPWEIYRAGGPEYVYDIFTKAGDLDTYHTNFALIPDLDFGFSVMATGDGSIVNAASSLIVDGIVKTLQEVSRTQARQNFAGTYKSTHAKLNSSVVIVVDNHPGLRITSWISNGTDVLADLSSENEDDERDDSKEQQTFEFRLFPNNLYGNGRVGFTGSYSSYPTDQDAGVFSDPCGTWTGPGGDPIGTVDLGSFAFDVDSAGSAVNLSAKGLRVILQRTI